MRLNSKLFIINMLFVVTFSSCASTNSISMVTNADCLKESILAFKKDTSNFLVHTEYFLNYECQQPPPLPYHDSFVLAQKKIIRSTQSKGIRAVIISCEWPSYSLNPFHVSTIEEHYRKCDSMDAADNIIGYCVDKYYNHLKDSLDYKPELDFNDPVLDAQKQKSKLFMKLYKTRDSLLREEMKDMGDWTKIM